jgi:putative peptidoglycan lipid II flippase
VATVLMPHLSVLLGAGNKTEATKTFTDALAGCLALALGSCVGLFLLAPEMMQSLLKHGQMTDFAAKATAWTMMGYVIGLPAYILTKVTAPAFFAAEDPVSPVKAGAYALIVNGVINAGFVLAWRAGYMQETAFIGIAVATAIGGYVNAFCQWRWLNQKGVLAIDRQVLARDVGKMLMVSGAMAVVLIGIKVLVPYGNDWNLLLKLVWLGAALGIGGLVFVAGIEYSGLLNLRQVVKDMKHRKKMKVAMKPKDGESVDLRGDF